jgi:hypothetical protein
MSKIAIASQANNAYKHNSIKNKILSYITNIFFWQQYLKKDLIPKYVSIKVPNTSAAVKKIIKLCLMMAL